MRGCSATIPISSRTSFRFGPGREPGREKLIPEANGTTLGNGVPKTSTSDTIGFSSSLAAVTALLVSYHLLTHELILLLPLLLFLLSETVGVEGKIIDVRMVLVVLLCLTPLYVFLMWKAGCFFLFSLVLLWLYLRLLLTPAPAEVPA